MIPDNANLGETDAIEMATRFCESRGVDSTLVIPGDIPLISGRSSKKFSAPPRLKAPCLFHPPMAAAPTRSGAAPQACFPLRFGNDSFMPHLSAAHATQRPCVVLSLPGIALDIDHPSDLAQLAASGETRSQRLVRQWDSDFRRLRTNKQWRRDPGAAPTYPHPNRG